MKSPLRFASHALAVLALSGLLSRVFVSRFPRAAATVDGAWEDALIRWSGRRAADPRVVLAAIDDVSIARIGSLPWPRDVQARLIDRLTELQVRTIAYDVMFLDPSRNAAADKKLAQATARSGRVIHAMVLDGGKPETPLPEVARGAAGLGAVNAKPDRDGMLRVLSPRVVDASGQEWFSLETAAVAHYLREDPRQVAAEAPAGARIAYRGPWDAGTFRSVPVAKILDDQLSAEERAALRDSLVFVGSTDVRYFDHYPSPYGGIQPGIFSHLSAADNLLNGRPLRRASRATKLLLGSAPPALLILAGASLSAAVYAAAAAGAIVLVLAVGWAAYLAGVWLGAAAGASALLAALAWTLALRVVRASPRSTPAVSAR